MKADFGNAADSFFVLIPGESEKILGDIKFDLPKTQSGIYALYVNIIKNLESSLSEFESEEDRKIYKKLLFLESDSLAFNLSLKSRMSQSLDISYSPTPFNTVLLNIFPFYVEQAKGDFYHEVAHAFILKINALKGKSADIVRNKLYKIAKCYDDLHREIGDFQPKRPNDPMISTNAFSGEDLADIFISVGSIHSGSDFNSLCQSYSIDLSANKGDVHSSYLARLLNVHLNSGNSLPLICLNVPVLDEKPRKLKDIKFESCL